MYLKVLYFKIIFLNIFSKLIVTNGKVCPEINVCQDLFILLSSEKNSAKVIDVMEGSLVKLNCCFCSAELDYEPKLWYYKKRGLRFSLELLTGRGYIYKNMSITPEHVLKIYHFINSVHSGIYICKNPQTEDQTETIFTYVLEGVYASHNVHPFVGLFNEWVHYKEEILDPINKQFEISAQEPFKTFKTSFDFSFRVKTYWEPWGKCELSNGLEGHRTKIGKCRLIVVPNKRKIIEVGSALDVDTINQLYINESYDVPCRSINLNENLPEISKLVRRIPNYEAKDPCVLERRTLLMPSWINEFKFSSIIQIPEDGYVMLACPGSVLKSKVEWYKDGKLLNSTLKYNIAKNEQEPRITIDSHNSLFIFHVTKKEEGNYSCVVNKIKMYKYDVKVFTKSSLLTDDFYRYSIYLGFVLLLTTTCYCAGICVAWHERASFSDPLNLNNKKEQCQHLLRPVDLEQ